MVKTVLQIEEESLNSYIDAVIPSIEGFIRDYIHLPKDEEIPRGLELTMCKMIEYNLVDSGTKRKKIKDVDIEFNTDYPINIYKSLNKYRRLRVLQLNKIKLRREVYNAFKPYMKDVIIKRDGLNDYKERSKDLYVCTIEGYYSLGKNLIVVNYVDAGAVNKNYNEMLSVMITEDSKKVKKDDYFCLDNIKYRIINIQNVSDIYLDFTLERV